MTWIASGGIGNSRMKIDMNHSMTGMRDDPYLDGC